jgi:hypothetical protein
MYQEGHLCLYMMGDPPAIVCNKLQHHLAERLQECLIAKEHPQTLLIRKHHFQYLRQIRNRQLHHNLETVTVLNGLQNTPHIKHILQHFHRVYPTILDMMLLQL